MSALIRRLLFSSSVGCVLVLGVLAQAGMLPRPKIAAARSGGPPVETNRTSAPARVVAEGRVTAYPGAEVVVGTEIAGRVLDLRVKEKSVVHKGDLIAELNAADLAASRREAIAQADEAEADIRYYTSEVHRQSRLLAGRALAQEDLDKSLRMLEASRARRARALASAEHSKALIDKTQILAPIDGVVTARFADPGETLAAGSAIVSIVDLARLRIEAEVDEYDSDGIKEGDRVEITAEGVGGRTWASTVEEVPDEVVPRRLRPEDPGRPIDARVLPVKIKLPPGVPFKLGRRVEVSIAIAGSR